MIRTAALAVALMSATARAQAPAYSPDFTPTMTAAMAAEVAARNAAISAAITASQCKWNYVAGSPVTIGATTTETSVASAPALGSLTIPTCATSGAFEIQMHIDGNYTAAMVAPGTLTQAIKFNGTPVCQVVLGNLATSGASGLGAHGNAFITVSAAGAVKCTGFLGYQITGTMEAPGYWATVGSPTITPGAAIVVDYSGKWSAASNSVTATALIGTLVK